MAINYQRTRTRYVVCIKNKGYRASLEKRKIYKVIPDAEASAHKLIRVVDESGEDYLYPTLDFHEKESPTGNRLDALTGARKGQHSIRINDQYRICFVWTDSGPDQVEITAHR